MGGVAIVIHHDTSCRKFVLKIILFAYLHSVALQLGMVRMAERSKALRSGRSPLLWAWVRIPLLTINVLVASDLSHKFLFVSRR